jgi:hypothetical protein
MSAQLEEYRKIQHEYGVKNFEYADRDEDMPETEEDEWDERIEAIAKKMTEDDWLELARKSSHGQTRAYYAERAKKAQAREKKAA